MWTPNSSQEQSFPHCCCLWGHLLGCKFKKGKKWKILTEHFIWQYGGTTPSTGVLQYLPELFYRVLITRINFKGCFYLLTVKSIADFRHFRRRDFIACYMKAEPRLGRSKNIAIPQKSRTPTIPVWSISLYFFLVLFPFFYLVTPEERITWKSLSFDRMAMAESNMCSPRSCQVQSRKRQQKLFHWQIKPSILPLFRSVTPDHLLNLPSWDNKALTILLPKIYRK